MKGNPLVSIIIPTYNRPYYLKTRSISSVLKQTYSNWELIVVEDGNTESLIGDIVKSFGDPRIRHIAIERPDYSSLTEKQRWHACGAAARNRGLKESCGDIIAPLDDDDEFFPSHLEQCVAQIYDGIFDFVYGSTLIRNFETGNEYIDYFPWYEENTWQIFSARNIIYHSSVCYDAKYRDMHYSTDGHVPGDYDLWCRIKSAGANFTSLEEPQSVYYGESRSAGVRLSVPSLPPIENFTSKIETIYESRILSNQGEFCTSFEKSVADFVETSFTIATPSGDSALLIAFQTLKNQIPKHKRQVIIPSYAHSSTANSALWCGFELIFCDIDMATLGISPATVAPLLGENVAAVVAIHTHGNPCDMQSLKTLANDHGALLISDATAAFGAKLSGKYIGGFGDIEIFSFSETKILTAGEGGMICTPHEMLAETARRIANYENDKNYYRHEMRINGKLAEIPAALAVAGLPYVEKWINSRHLAANFYRQNLEHLSEIRFQEPFSENARGSMKEFPLILNSAEKVRQFVQTLSTYQIQTRSSYRSLHLMKSFCKSSPAVLPVTDKLSDCVICIPLYSDIRFEVLEMIINLIKSEVIK